MLKKVYRKISTSMLSFLMAFSVCGIYPMNVMAMDGDKGIEVGASRTELEQAIQDARNSGVTTIQDGTQEKNNVAEIEADYSNQVTAIRNMKNSLDDYNQKKTDYDNAKAQYDIEKAKYDADYAQYLLDYEAFKNQLATEQAALAAALADYERHKNEEGYLSEPYAKSLIYDSEPDAVLSTTTDGKYMSADAVDEAFSHDTDNYNNQLLQLDNMNITYLQQPNDVASSQELYGNFGSKAGWKTNISSNQLVKWTTVLLKRGQSVTATYTNLNNSYYNGKKISKVVFKYTLTEDSKFYNPTGMAWLGIFTDPTLGVFASAYTGTFEKNTSIFVKNEFTFYDQDGNPIEFNDALLSVASLNREHNSIELAKDYTGRFIKISGSTIGEKNSMVYATDSLNFKKGEGGCEHTMYPRQNEPGSGWDSSDAPNSWYGAGALLLNGPNNSVTLGATSATNILPAPYGPYVPGKNNEDGKKPNIWYSLNGHLRAVGLPEIKAKEPKKPVPPTEPVEPVKPESTIHYHYAVTYVKPDVQKAVTAADSTDLQGRTVEVGSRVDYTLNVATIPAHHETFESIVFNDNLPDGYEIDLEETKQGSADYEVEYDSSSRHIKFTAKSSLLASINADTTTTADIPAPKIIGKVTKAGTKYDNTFKLSLDNVYTVESKPVTVYTPTQPKKDVFKQGDTTTSIDGRSVKAGDILTYQITYTNTTGETRDVEITDTLPAHTTFVSADTNGVENNGTITWNVSGVEHGKSVTVSFQVKVDEDTQAEVIENKGHTNDGINSFDTNTTKNPTPTQPKKDVFKPADMTTSIDGKPVKNGEEITYTIKYTNTTDAKRTVEVKDVIPEYTEYVTGTADNGGVYDAATKTVSWKVEDVAVGNTVEFHFSVKVKAEANGQVIENKADVHDGFNNVKTNTTTNPTPTQPKKDVFTGTDTTSIDGKAVVAGQELTYKITYTNTTGTNQDVVVTDKLPAYTTYVEDSADNGGTLTGDVLTWNLMAVPTGTTVSVTFKVKVNDDVNGEVIKNVGRTKDGVNEVDTNTTTNPTPTQPKKDVFTGTDTTSIDGKAVVAGQELTYKIKYINTTGAEQEVTITDVIPAHTSYVESSATDNGVYTSADTKLTWTKKVANGTVWTVTFKVKVNDDVSGEVIKNVGRTKDGVNEVDTNTTTNPTPTQPKKDVFKQGDTTTSIDGRSVKAGDILTYQITYTNTTGETRDVEITDEIPEYTEYVFRSATENGIYDGTKRTITWTKTLSDQETWTVQFDVKISGDINGQVVENTADVQDGLNQYTTNTTRNPTPTKPKKDVHEKGKTDISIDGQKVNAGQEITYSISYTNTTDAMLDVEVKDVIPAYTTYVPSSANLNGTYNPATNTVSWKKENLAVGEKVTFTFNVKINEDVDEVIIENKAIVKDGFGEWETNKTKNPTIPQRINPKTSDSTHIFMYMGVLIVSVLFGMVAYHTKSVYR